MSYGACDQGHWHYATEIEFDELAVRLTDKPQDTILKVSAVVDRGGVESITLDELVLTGTGSLFEQELFRRVSAAVEKTGLYADAMIDVRIAA